jgi:hypothetical protein
MAQLQATTVDGTLVSLRTENVTTASKTLQLADRDKVVACNNTTTITITIPADATVNFPVGSVVYIAKVNSGTVNLAAAAGVTANRTGELAAGEELYCRKRAANSWIVVDQPYFVSGSGGTTFTTGNFNGHTFTSSGTFIVS